MNLLLCKTKKFGRVTTTELYILYIHSQKDCECNRCTAKSSRCSVNTTARTLSTTTRSLLVSCHSSNVGYNLFNLALASIFVHDS